MGGSAGTGGLPLGRPGLGAEAGGWPSPVPHRDDRFRPEWWLGCRAGMMARWLVISSFPRFTVLADPEGNELCLTES